MQISYSDKELFVFRQIAEAAQELNFPCFVIGGFVRDKLLGRKI
jgi:poly(A) polymerase